MESMDTNLEIANFKASTNKLTEALNETSNSMEKIFPILIESLKTNEKIDHIINNMVTKEELKEKNDHIINNMVTKEELKEKNDHIINNMVTKEEFKEKIESLEKNIKLNEKNSIIRYENRFCSTTNQQNFEWLFVTFFFYL